MANKDNLAATVAAPFWAMLWFLTLGHMGRRPAWLRTPHRKPPLGGHRPTDGGDNSHPPQGGSGGSLMVETGTRYSSFVENGPPPGPDIVGRVVARIKIRDQATEDNNFFRAYAAIEAMTMEQVRDKLLKLGRWPAERMLVRVLDWEEAVERLSNDTQSCLAMVRAVVALEDADGKLYLVKTPELATGLRMEVLKAMGEAEMEVAVREGYKVH